jgi:hypothetical protein
MRETTGIGTAGRAGAQRTADLAEPARRPWRGTRQYTQRVVDSRRQRAGQHACARAQCHYTTCDAAYQMLKCALMLHTAL